MTRKGKDIMNLLENVMAASGGLPPVTGNEEEDNRELRAFLDRLLKTLERNFEAIGRHLEEDT